MKRLGLFVLIISILFTREYFVLSPHVYAQTLEDEGAKCTAAQGKAGIIIQGVCAPLSNSTSSGINEGSLGAIIAILHSDLNTVNIIHPDIGGTATSAEVIKSDYYKSFDALATAYYNSVKSDSSMRPKLLKADIFERIQQNLSAQINSLRVSTQRNKERIQIGQDFYGQIRVMAETARAEERLEAGTINQKQADEDIQNANTDKTVRDTNLADARDPSACSFFKGNLVGCLDTFVSWLIKHTIMAIAGYLVWFTANMLNFSIQYGILNFSQWAPDTLYPIWIIIRQITSLFIVFAGLWLCAEYIMGRNEKFQKYFAWLIIYALFVNLSYPISRIPIDISNIISLNVYSSAIGLDTLSSSADKSVGAILTTRLGLPGIVTNATSAEGVNKGFSSINSTAGALMAVAFLLYTAFIFFMVSLILIFRTLALVGLTIASPILFVDSVVPALGKQAEKMRKIYFEQLAVAPVFMIMLALTLKFFEVFSGSLSVGSGIGSIAGAGNARVFFNILMMLIMLHIMYKVTKQLSGKVGEFATGIMGNVGGFGLGVATGGAGLLGRSTFGRAAMGIRDSKWVERNQDGFIGKRVYNMSNAVASSTFDARNSSTLNAGVSTLTKHGIIDRMPMGKGSSVGYEKQLEARNKEWAESYGRIKQTYEEDVKDASGTILHRKGDVIEEGKVAANRFVAKKQGYFADKLTNSRSAIPQLKGIQDKQNEAETSGVDKIANKFEQEYKTADKKFKPFVLSNLQKQFDDVKKTDPNLEGEQARALGRAIKKIESSNNKEKEEFNKQTIRAFNEYNTLEEGKRKTFFARQTDEIQNALRALLTASNPPAPTQAAMNQQQTASQVSMGPTVSPSGIILPGRTSARSASQNPTPTPPTPAAPAQAVGTNQQFAQTSAVAKPVQQVSTSAQNPPLRPAAASQTNASQPGANFQQAPPSAVNQNPQITYTTFNPATDDFKTLRQRRNEARTNNPGPASPSQQAISRKAA
jgi:hypothetical protein